MKITLERDEAELPRDKSTPFHMGALSLVLGEDCDHFPFHWTELETKVSVSQLHFPPFHPDLGWLSDWWAIWGNWQVLKGAAEGTGFSTGTALWVACVPWALLMLPHRRTHPYFPLTSYSMRQMKFVFSLITAHLDMPLKNQSLQAEHAQVAEDQWCQYLFIVIMGCSCGARPTWFHLRSCILISPSWMV